MSAQVVWTKSSGKPYTPLVPSKSNGVGSTADSVASLIKNLGGGTITDLGTLGFEAGRSMNPAAKAISDPLANTFKNLSATVAPNGNISPSGVAGELGRNAAGGASWGLPTLPILGGGTVGSTLGNMALTGAARGGLFGVSQQQSPKGIATSASVMSLLEPILGTLLNPNTFRAQAGSEIGRAVENYAGKSPDAQSILDRITNEGTQNIKPQNIPAAKEEVNNFLKNLNLPKDANSQDLFSFLVKQKQLQGEGFDATTTATSKKVANNIASILADELHNLSPEYKLADQAFKGAAGVSKTAQGVQKTLTSMPGYMARRAVGYALLYPIIRSLLKQ